MTFRGRYTGVGPLLAPPPGGRPPGRDRPSAWHWLLALPIPVVLAIPWYNRILFTRGIYRQFLRPTASAAEETRVGRIASLAVKVGALAAIWFLNPQFALDFQLIGGVIVLQILPAVALGVMTRWMHRWALLAGLAAGLAVGVLMLFETPRLGPGGAVLRRHFGGSAFPLARLGFDTPQSVYVGLVALAVNLAVVLGATLVLRRLRVPVGVDLTESWHYMADEGDPALDRMTDLVDGSETPVRVGRHVCGS
jgi:SSS family solute:Na+ symporter